MQLTYEEKRLLRELSENPQVDRDCIPERVLVNLGLAERVDVGMLRITEAGRNRAETV